MVSVDGLFEPAHALRQTFALERALGNERELFRLERFGEAVVGPRLDGVDRALDRSVSGHDDNLGVGEELLRPLEHVDTGHTGHAQVGHDEVERLLR